MTVPGMVWCRSEAGEGLKVSARARLMVLPWNRYEGPGAGAQPPESAATTRSAFERIMPS